MSVREAIRTRKGSLTSGLQGSGGAQAVSGAAPEQLATEADRLSRRSAERDFGIKESCCVKAEEFPVLEQGAMPGVGEDNEL